MNKHFYPKFHPCRTFLLFPFCNDKISCFIMLSGVCKTCWTKFQGSYIGLWGPRDIQAISFTGASWWISSHFCKVVSKPAAHLARHGDACFVMLRFRDLFLLLSLPPFDSRDSAVSVEAWLYKESRKWRDSINSERRSSRTKASLKRNVSGS